MSAMHRLVYRAFSFSVASGLAKQRRVATGAASETASDR